MQMQIEKKKKLKISEILELFINSEILKHEHELYAIRGGLDLYREPSDDPLEPLTKDMVCYADDAMTATDDGEDVYPTFSKMHGLDFFYSGERLVDVMVNVFHQIKNPSIDILVDALNYYDENDDFLDVNL